jgi:hypothetical protein
VAAAAAAAAAGTAGAGTAGAAAARGPWCVVLRWGLHPAAVVAGEVAAVAAAA